MVSDPFFRYPKRVSKIRLRSRVFGSKMDPKTNSKRKNTTENRYRPRTSFFSPMCDRLGSRKWKPRTPLTPLKLFVFLHQNETSFFRPEVVFVSILVPAWLHFGTILGCKWVKKPRKSCPSPLLKTTVFLNGFLIDFLTILVPKRGGSSMP